MHGLHRGAAVAYGPHFGVVWLGSFTGRVSSGAPENPALIFPILVERRRVLAADMVLELHELIAAGIELPRGWLRPTAPQLHAPDTLRRVGELRGQAVCRFVAAVSRALQHATVEARYELGARQNCTHAEAVPVNMND